MEKIIEIFKTQNGYLQSKQIENRNMRYKLQEMLNTGDVYKIKRGLYKHSKFSSNNELGEVCQIVPKGVLCLFSAWQHYELTTTVSSVYHIAIPHKAKIKLSPYPPIKLYYWIEDYYNLGITNTETQGEQITVYSLEKSVCDAVKFRNKIGIEITTEVLKSYIKRKDRNIDLLMKFAEKMRVEKVITPYLQTLL